MRLQRIGIRLLPTRSWFFPLIKVQPTPKPPAPQTPVRRPHLTLASDAWPCSTVAPGLFRAWFVCLRGGGTVLLSPPNIYPSFIHLHSPDGRRCHHPRAASSEVLRRSNSRAHTSMHFASGPRGLLIFWEAIFSRKNNRGGKFHLSNTLVPAAPF